MSLQRKLNNNKKSELLVYTNEQVRNICKQYEKFFEENNIATCNLKINYPQGINIILHGYKK